MLKHYMKLLIPFVLIIIGLVAIVINMDNQLRNQNAMKLSEQNSLQIAQAMQSTLKQANEDIHFLAGLQPIKSLVQDDSVATRKFVENTLLNLMQSRNDYLQIRVLRADGQELVKIVHKQQVQLTPQDELQNKSQRTYFKQALTLPPNKIYQSVLDLNKEFGQIEQPLKPTVRLLTPIYAKGKVAAVVAINLNINQLFSRVTQLTNQQLQHVSIINKDGYFLYSPEPSRNWGFMYEREDLNLSQENPALWQHLQSQPKTQLSQIIGEHYYGIHKICSYNKCHIDTPNTLFLENDALDLPWTIISHSKASAWYNLNWVESEWPYLLLALLVITFGFAIRIATQLGRSSEHLSKQSQTLEDNNDRFIKVIESIPDGLIILGNNRRIELVNNAIQEILGMKEDELIGHPIEVFMSGRFKEQHYAKTDSFFEQPRLIEVTRERPYVYHHPNGSERYLQAKINPVQYQGQTIAIVLVKDATQSIKQEDQLRQSQKLDALGQLTGGVAHDFNNLLAVMLGNLELLEMQVQDAPKLQERIGKITNAVNTAAELTQKLLAVSRKKTLSTETIEVKPFMEGVIDMLHRTIKSGVEIQSTIESHLSNINADPHELTNALINLAINARDAMPTGGKLLIRAEQTYLDRDYIEKINDPINEGHYILISVEDNGSGIPKALIDKVLEPFFTTKPKGKGTGLGLAMIYGFIKQSHGHMRIYSEEGSGTNIHLYLPIAENQEESQQHKPEIYTPANWSQYRALVVDDEVDLAEVAATYLELTGMEVEVCHSAVAAWQLIQGGQEFDLIFSDVVMPGEFDGLGLYQRIKDRQLECKVILASGFSEEMISKQHHLDPELKFIRKPYKREQMLQAVEEALR